MAFLQKPTNMPDAVQSPSPPSSNPPQKADQSTRPTTTTSASTSTILSTRSLKQATLFFAGATFLTASVFITKRTIAKRQLSVFPKRFTPSNKPPQTPINGPFEALEALNLATLNVSAFGIMMVGGMGWALDVSNMEELKRKVRGGMGVDGTGRDEQDVEEEFEEWLATVLERKKEKEKENRRKGPGGGQEGIEGRRWVNERGRER